MVGSGEYTTGYVGGSAADSDKGACVVALTMFDLGRRGKVSKLGMYGVNVGIEFRVRLLFYMVSACCWSRWIGLDDGFHELNTKASLEPRRAPTVWQDVSSLHLPK